ncbi:MAG: methyltransferase domain-containing protein [Bacteroidia bacterium]|nr:methyltransferase domain-containing protein [Bacteroidia bacterium]
MKQQEQNAYILGTESKELQRLGLQHQVWASEAHRGWLKAGFTAGQTILDLGCGPGFCAKELGYVVGPKGKVIAVDKSEAYIRFLNKLKNLYNLPIEAHFADFSDMKLKNNSLDGVYCRWAMAWIPNVKEVLAKIHKALKPGAKVVFHEYYDWSLLQTSPEYPNLKRAIKQSLQTFFDSEGTVDIGKFLPGLFTELGMKVISQRPMNKLATPNKLDWQWPRTFFQIYFPKVSDAGYLTVEEVKKALEELEILGQNPNATILTPQMVEVIAQK